jgi:hypothetical protein
MPSLTLHVTIVDIDRDDSITSTHCTSYADYLSIIDDESARCDGRIVDVSGFTIDDDGTESIRATIVGNL